MVIPSLVPKTILFPPKKKGTITAILYVSERYPDVFWIWIRTKLYIYEKKLND